MKRGKTRAFLRNGEDTYYGWLMDESTLQIAGNDISNMQQTSWNMSGFFGRISACMREKCSNPLHL